MSYEETKKKLLDLQADIACVQVIFKEKVKNTSVSNEEFQTFIKQLKNIKRKLRKLNSNLILKQKKDLWKILYGHSLPAHLL